VIKLFFIHLILFFYKNKKSPKTKDVLLIQILFFILVNLKRVKKPVLFIQFRKIRGIGANLWGRGRVAIKISSLRGVKRRSNLKQNLF